MSGELTVARRRPTRDRHTLSRHHFEFLATGGGDADTVAELLRAERSWRLIQLRALLDAVRSDPDAAGPLPPVDEAWQLLVAAQRQAPSEVETLLLHPQAGTWAGYTLRRLRGSTTDPAPVWVDLGYLHALAAVAGIRAGLTFRIRVPVREGFVILPTLGGAHLPVDAAWTVAELDCAAGVAALVVDGTRVEIPAGGSPVGADSWVRVPELRARAGGQTLAVDLNHLDPYRNLRTPTPPDRLASAQIERWQALLERAWELIVSATPDLAGPIARGLCSVVPQPAAERFRTMSASAGDAFGSTIVSEPEDAPELAVTLVHEFQHIKLGGLLHLTPLHHAEPAQRLYAPWRDDPRPLGGLLQGVYAFVGITEFWRALRRRSAGRTAQLAQFEFARWRVQVHATLEMIAGLAELTDAGRQLVAGLAGTAATWAGEAVPTPVRQRAEAAVADHRARWRMHHLRPEPAVVARYAAAWAVGESRPALEYPAPVVATDPAARRLDTRAVLALWRITDEDGFAALEKDAAAVATQVSGATPADLAYTAGDLDRARQLYLAELAADPTSPGAWAGLGRIEDATGGTAAATALRERPEFVRAVYGASVASGAAADPLAVAAWIGN